MTGVRWMLVLLVLCGPAALPTLAIVGARPVAVPLLLPAGSLLAAIAGVAAVATRTSLVAWVVVVDVAAVAASVVVMRRRVVIGRRHGGDTRGGLGPLLAGAAVMVAGLLPLRHTVLDWDARSIWMLHARLFDAGGASYVHALQNGAYAFSHPDYPPLVPATVALAWKVWGSPSYRVGQVMPALVAASLFVVAGWLVARRVRGREAAWVAPALAASFAFAAIGATDGYLTDGYADVVAAAAATVAALALLAEPPSTSYAGLGVTAALIAALTKDEGLVAALVVVALWLARLLLQRHYRRLRLVAVGTGAAMLVWPLLVAALGGPSGSVLDAPDSGAASTSRLTRLHDAFSALRDQVPVLWLVAVVALLALAARWARRRDRVRPVRGAASLGWLGAFVLLDLVALLVTYTVGRAPIVWWLNTSVSRVTILARLLLYASAALAIAIAIDRGPSDRSLDDPERAAEKVSVTT